MATTQDRKEAINRLVDNFARSSSTEAEWLNELIEHQYEDAKGRLVDAMDNDILRIQGEAKYLERFSKQLAGARALLLSGRGNSQ